MLWEIKDKVMDRIADVQSDVEEARYRRRREAERGPIMTRREAFEIMASRASEYNRDKTKDEMPEGFVY
jgi:hypothetical protein